MELHQLRYFIKLSETLHFTQAADELFITQPALSQQIKQLEAELGVPLFNRTGKKIRLNNAGNLFLEYARSAVNEIARGEQAMADLKNKVNGTVRIGIMYSYFAPLLSVMADFCKQYPGVKTHLRYASNDELIEMLKKSELDIALTFDNNPPDELETKGEFTAQLKIAVAQKHPFAAMPTISLLQLKSTLLALPATGNIIRKMVEDSFNKYKIWPFVNSELNDLQLLVDLIARGDFATIITDTAISDRENIVLIDSEEPLPSVKGVVLVRKNTFLSKASLLFLDCILKKLTMISQQAGNAHVL